MDPAIPAASPAAFSSNIFRQDDSRSYYRNFRTKCTDFIFKFECNFTNIDLLQEGLCKTFLIISNDDKISESEFSWLSWDSKVLKRSIPSIATDKLQRITKNDLVLLKTGSYTSITRFDRGVERFENPLSKLSKDTKALMLRTDTYSLKEKHSLLENTIYLIPN